MTKTNMDLVELLQKQDQGDFLRSVAEAVLQMIMEADVEGVIGAGGHERGEHRTTWRNGYRDRALDTRLGTLNLKVPKLRQGTYFPGFLEARKMSERACRGDPGSVDRRRLHPARRRPRAGDGLERHLEEHRLQVIQGHRRACRRVPEPPADWQMALCVDFH